MKNKIPYLFFVLAGSTINFIFYLKFFENTNYDPWVYWIISIIFTGITAILYYNGFKKHKKAVVWCAVIISVFSIFCSTAGQFADSQIGINQKINESGILNRKQINLDYAWKELERLNTEWDSLEKEKRATIRTAADRYEWKRTTANIDGQQAQIKIDKAKYESIIFDKESVDIEIDTEYASDIFDQITFGNIQQKIITMLIFEILISIIIELVAPLSLYLMTLSPVVKEPAAKKQSFKDDVIWYASARWNGSSNGTLKGRPYVLEKTGMSIKRFNQITSIALKKGLIIIEGKITKSKLFLDKEEFVKAMIPAFSKKDGR